jgi:carbohydrate esterase-like sialic acid-specific acetylesterase
MILALALALALQPQAEEPALVFLLAGQSNMGGHAKGPVPEAWRGQPSNLLFFEAGEFRKLGPRDYDSGAVLREGDKGIGRFGPEVSFGHEIAKAFPRRTILLVKLGPGGAPLAGRWTPDVRGQHYDRLLEEYRSATQGRRVVPAAVIWAQGTADAMKEEAAKAYGANLKLLVERLRKDLSAPDLPFLYSTYAPDEPIEGAMLQKRPFLRQVVAAYAETARQIPGMARVSRTGLTTLGGDDPHYDAAGQIEFGRRYAAVTLELLKEKK